MMEKVFIVDRAVAMKIVDDPRIKRRGEASYYDGQLFGVEGTVVHVRGPEELFSMEILKSLKEAENAAEIMEKIREMSDNTASGVGLIFG